MEIKAVQKFIRQSPRKVRLVADLIRHLKIDDALNQLSAIKKQAALPVEKTLKSALANATNNLKLDKSTLSIKEIQVNEGSTYKRWQPVSRGRAHPILKRTCHIRIILESKQPKPQAPKTQAKRPISKTNKTNKAKKKESK